VLLVPGVTVKSADPVALPALVPTIDAEPLQVNCIVKA